MFRIVTLVSLMAALLLAGGASPLVRPKSGNIVDVGSHSPQSYATVPKVWMQYAATYEDVQRVIIGKARVYSEPELCLSDEDYVENCPIDPVTCSPTDEWSTGAAEKRASSQVTASTASDVQSCTESNQTHCEYYHDIVPQTVTDVPKSAIRTAHYTWASVLNTYCSDSAYTLGTVNGAQKCYLEDIGKRLFSGYNYYYQCYLENGTEAIPSNRIRCGSLYDWQHLASQYYGGAVYDQGTQEASCTQSTANPDWGDWCGTNMRVVTGCSDGYTRVSHWYDNGLDDKWTSCLKLMNASHTCPTGYTYSSSQNACYKFSHYTYSCPSGYGNIDSNHVCHKTVYSCEQGFTGPDVDGNCHHQGYIRSSCPNPMLVEQNAVTGQWVCRYTYYYYDYTCPSDLNVYEVPWDVVDEGGDCGGCGAYGCECNSETPPPNNCHRLLYMCPFDNSRLCTEIPKAGEGNVYTNKPMIVHAVTGQYVPAEYGHARKSLCGADCDHAVYRIEGEGSRLRFMNRTGNDVNMTVDGCVLTGTIEAAAGDHISAIRTGGGSDPHTLFFYGRSGNNLGTISSSCPVNGGVGIPRVPMNITSVIVKRDQLWFWDSYDDRGQIGMIEFVKEVAPEDAAEGYRPTPFEAFKLRGWGFDRIFYADNNTTYAINDSGIDTAQCDSYAAEVGFGRVQPSDADSDEVLAEILKNTVGSLGGGAGGVQSATCFGGQDASLFYNPVTDRCEQEGTCRMEVLNTGSNQNPDVNVTVPVPDALNEFHLQNGTATYDFYVAQDCTFYDLPVFAPGQYNWRVGTISNPPVSWTWDYWGYIVTATLSGGSAATSEVPQCPPGALGRNGATCIMPSGGVTCMLAKRPDYSFARTTFAQKDTGMHSEPPKWFCSPYVCANHACQKATCYAGYTGSLIPVDMNNPPEPGDCTAQVCDANKPHYEFCGKYKDCPTEQPDVVQTAGGCKRVTCADGGYNPDDKMCYKWQCPQGTTESGGVCVPN